MDALEPLLTTEDVANFLKVDVVTVRRLVSRNEIGAYRIGNEYRFSMGDVRTFLERQHIPPRTGLPAAFDVKVSRSGQQDFVQILKRALRLPGDLKTATILGAELEQLSGVRRRKSGLLSKLSARAVRGLNAAVQQAQALNKPYIGTEHLLLGLLSVRNSAAAQALAKHGVSYERAREAAAGITASENVDYQPPPNELPMTEATKRMIEAAFKQAKKLGHDYVGSEHLLLGLLGEHNSVGNGVLQFLQVDLERLREELNGPPSADHAPQATDTDQ